MIRIISRFLTGIFSLLILLHAYPASAFRQADFDCVTDGGTCHYDPTDTDTCADTGAATATATSSGSGPSLPSDITRTIDKLKPEYIKASEATGVPWQLLAAIHYRETGLSANGTNLFQILGNSSSASLSAQATEAGNFIQKSAVSANLSNHKAPLKPTGNDPEEIKDTLYSYNGRAAAYASQAAKLGFDSKTQPYEGSPYVMNNFDSKHHNMGIITHDNGGVDGTDTRYGAYTIYAGLGGDTDSGSATASSSGDCAASDSSAGDGAVTGDAVKTAIKYAWPTYHPAVYCTERASYHQAILKAKANGEYTGGDCDSTNIGVDCGAFVTRVMRDSGVDPDYNKGNGNTVTQQQYLDDMVSKGKYEKVSAHSTADLKPGDIAINSDHTYMYVGTQPDFKGNSASASVGGSSGAYWRAPMASAAYGIDGEFTWYRLKAK